MSRRERWVIFLMLLAGACAGEREPGQAVGTQDDSGMDGMAMPGMRMPSVEMLPGMRAHLDSLRLARPAEIPALVPTHRTRAEALLKAVDQDMKDMSMVGDARWLALVDTVRTDLAAFPGLHGEALVLRMRAHGGRMRRLLELHERMMKM